MKKRKATQHLVQSKPQPNILNHRWNRKKKRYTSANINGISTCPKPKITINNKKSQSSFYLCFLLPKTTCWENTMKHLFPKCEAFKMHILKYTYARDFPLKIIGGATAAKIQKPMCTCMDKWEHTSETFFQLSGFQKIIKNDNYLILIRIIMMK